MLHYICFRSLLIWYRKDCILKCINVEHCCHVGISFLVPYTFFSFHNGTMFSFIFILIVIICEFIVIGSEVLAIVCNQFNWFSCCVAFAKPRKFVARCCRDRYGGIRRSSTVFFPCRNCIHWAAILSEWYAL